MLKIVIFLIVISIIFTTPQAFAQISLGTPAEHVSIRVTIEGNGDVSIVHVIKKSDVNVQIRMLPGEIENLQVVDGNRNEIPHAVSTDNSIVTLVPPRVDFGVEYDLKDVLILKEGVWTWDFLYTDSENGVEFYFPEKVDLIFVNDRPVDVTERGGMRCHGCDMFLEYVIDEPIILKEVEWEGQKFPVFIRTVDEINSFNFDQPARKLSFENSLEGKFITITIPLELLWNPYDVYLDGEKIYFHNYYQNDTHGWVNIKPETVGTIEIIGISAIPEFSLLIPLVLGIAIVIGFQTRSKINLH